MIACMIACMIADSTAGARGREQGWRESKEGGESVTREARSRGRVTAAIRDQVHRFGRNKSSSPAEPSHPARARGAGSINTTVQNGARGGGWRPAVDWPLRPPLWMKCMATPSWTIVPSASAWCRLDHPAREHCTWRWQPNPVGSPADRTK